MCFRRFPINRVNHRLLVATVLAGLPAQEPPPRAPPRDEAKAGTFDYISLASKTLARQVEVGVYLPFGYATSKERYATLFFLHGRNGIARDVSNRELPSEIDRLIASGDLPPVVIAFPNCEGSMYVDWLDGRSPWQEFLATELVSAIDGSYRTIPERALRGLEGDAAGGMGALLLAFRHPELFATVATHGAALYPLDPSRATQRLAPRRNAIEPAFGWPIDVAHWQRNHPLQLARSAPLEDLKQLAIYFDCSEGEREGHDVTNAELHRVLEERGVPHEWHLRPAAARREYLQANLGHSLRFHGRHLKEALKSRADPSKQSAGEAPAPVRR